MAGLFINDILAKPDIPIGRDRSDEATLLPRVYANVWDPSKPAGGSPDGSVDGSLKPCGFLLDPKNQGVANIKLSGSVAYPQQWEGTLTPVLIGYLNDTTKTPVISAKIGQVTLPQRDAPTLPMNFTIDKFELAEPLKSDISPVPWRVAGDFKWRLTSDGMDDIISTNHSRLELYWLQGYAASGPLKVTSALMETNMDMQGKYPVSLLRYFLPSPADLATGTDLPKRPVEWWANFVMTKIKGVQYNAIDGRAGYGVGCCGGSFNWKDWTSAVNPFVNSFDLAALVQGAMSLLDPRFSNFELNWVCHTPDGFLQTCMPFGWSGSTNPSTAAGVNNPFFLGITALSGVHLPDPSTVLNCALHARAWLELFPRNVLKSPVVIDTAFNVKPAGKPSYEPEVAQLKRDAFIKAHLSKANGGVANALDNEVSLPEAACYDNDQFGTKQSGEKDTTARMGLANFFGANEPKFGTLPAPLVPMPALIRQAISAAVLLRKVPNSRWMYNDASLKAKNVMAILRNTTAFTAGNSWVSVAKGVTVITYIIDAVPLTPTVNGQICVKIHVYDDFNSSTEALALELSKFECNLAAALRPVAAPADPKAGNYFVETLQSVVFVRGNLLVDMTFIGKVAVKDAQYRAAVDMAVRLDAYLSHSLVMKTQVRRPSLALKTPPPLFNVVVNSTFDVTMADPELLAEELCARSNLGRVLLCTTGPVAGQLDRTFSFLAMSLDLPKVGQHAEVTIIGAHPDTYHPGFRTFMVTVQPA